MPCVGILGMRQVGKSTLLNRFAKSYETFDSPEFFHAFQKDSGFIHTAPYPLALDEVQKYPPAFDILKYAIDRGKRPGRFLISGSVRFSSRKAIRESLTGRISLIEIYPLTLAECNSQKLNNFLSFFLKSTSLAPIFTKMHPRFSDAQIFYYVKSGGLPGICFKREESHRVSQFENHIDTLLGRDIHFIYETQATLLQCRLLATELASIQGLPVNLADLSRKIGMSQPTVKKLLLAFEGIFLIRAHGDTYYLEDMGLSHHLHPVGTQLSKFDWIRLVYQELRSQIAAHHRFKAQLTTYTTRGGIDIPFFIRFTDKKSVAICVDIEQTVTQKSIKSLIWHKKKHPQSALVILSTIDTYQRLDNGIHVVPIRFLF